MSSSRKKLCAAQENRITFHPICKKYKCILIQNCQNNFWKKAKLLKIQVHFWKFLAYVLRIDAIRIVLEIYDTNGESIELLTSGAIDAWQAIFVRIDLKTFSNS